MMSRVQRILALGLLLAATLVATTSAPANASIPPLSVGYSATAIDSPLGDACTLATAIVAAHCSVHGTITTSLFGCYRTLSEDGVHLVWICQCEASTKLCIR